MTGKELLSLESAWTNHVGFTPDGKHLIIGDVEHIQIMALMIDGLAKIAGSRMTCSIPVEECQKYLQVEPCPHPMM